MTPSKDPALPLTFGERSGQKAIHLVRAAVRIAVIHQDESSAKWLFVTHPHKGLELPGGAVDPGESGEAAARRELAEEAGMVLPPEQIVHAAGTVPIEDGNGGHWLDLLYYTVVDGEFVQQKAQSQRGAEFPLLWLSEGEMAGRLSSNAQAVVAAIARTLFTVMK